MSNNSNTSGSGIGFLGLLAIVFITLKLCNVIAWSWWWVLAPLWGGVALIVGIMIIAIVVKLFALLIVALFSSKKKFNRR